MKRALTLVAALFTALGLSFTTLGSSNAAAVTFNSWPVQKSGSTGSQVTTVQYLLTAKGQSLAVDGSFGPTTKAKVIAFQKANGLSADGVVGPATWAKLTNVTLRNGSSGAAVKALQTQLRRNGYSSVAVDGKFGPATETAVRAFQKAKGLGIDGVVGPNTWRGLIAGVSTNGGGGGTTTRAALAKSILNDKGITLLHFCGPSYASPRQNIADAAAGRQSFTGGGDVGKRAVWLDTRMLTFMRDFGVNNSYRVTTILGCDHSSTSNHYKGTAVDIDYANGVKVSTTTSGRNIAAKIKNYCRSKGATEILGPGDAGHSGHVHCAWR